MVPTKGIILFNFGYTTLSFLFSDSFFKLYWLATSGGRFFVTILFLVTDILCLVIQYFGKINYNRGKFQYFTDLFLKLTIVCACDRSLN